MRYAVLFWFIFLIACSLASPKKPDDTNKAPKPNLDNDVMCTQDAKQCADGTWVGRTPPSCAFNCPNGDDASK